MISSTVAVTDITVYPQQKCVWSASKCISEKQSKESQVACLNSIFDVTTSQN